MERTPKTGGFSLIELTIVIIILVILAATVYFKWSSSAINLNAQAALLAGDIRYTQNLSMTQHQNFRLIITAPNTYEINDGSGNPVAIGSRIQPTLGHYIITLGQNIIFGISTPFTIVFDPKGTPYDNTGNSLSNVTIPLTSGGEIANVTINANTGRVTP